MFKKHEYKFIKEQFEKEGYTLLSKEYKNACSPLKIICNNDHETSMTYASFKTGKRCKFCSRNAPVIYDRVNKEFNKRGYVLLSKEYVNSSKKLEYICPNKHLGLISWNNFQRGHSCPKCYGNDVLTIDKVKKSFEEKGATLISKEYINSKEKLCYICPEGHEQHSSWDNWNAGHGCLECYNLNKFGPGNPSWKGGISFEPYCEIWKDTEFKNGIKQRDGYRCLNPYCISKNPEDLVVHHIDYNKKNCSPRNLITVCNSCNSRANKDRKWHKAWYQAIINSRGVV